MTPNPLTPGDLACVMEQTWPSADCQRLGPWTIRQGAGGGKRVSATTADAPVTASDLPQAEAAMREFGQPPLFLIRVGDGALDAMLAAHGYRVVDPVLAYAIATCGLADIAPPAMHTFPHWPPMAIATELWAEAGIGPARIAVMHRAAGPKTAVLARAKDRAAGIAFVALSGTTAMLHALEVTPALRRHGAAKNILRASAIWALDHGADTLSLVVTAANQPARRLYASLGMQVVGQYHYREK